MTSNTSMTVTLDPNAQGPLALAILISSIHFNYNLEWNSPSSLRNGDNEIIFSISDNSPSSLEKLFVTIGEMHNLTPEWTLFAKEKLGSTLEPLAKGKPSMQYQSVMSAITELNTFLMLETFLPIPTSKSIITSNDILLYSCLRCQPAFVKGVSGIKDLDEIRRWYLYLDQLPSFHDAPSILQNMASSETPKKVDSANYDIGLIDAKKGHVVTRFPPEPSGYLHIGHAKAAMLNKYFAELYEGKLIIRFDDTNPSKEKAEYEESILEDLNMLGIKGDHLSYSSDFFSHLEGVCEKFILEDNAYADDTEREKMQHERMHGIPSERRNISPEESLRIFRLMIAGEDEAQNWCIRAKLSVDSPNKALRDPVLYRCNRDVPHHRTGTRYKAYPTYDFACPIIDSLEGVTHALRTTEYHDRNDQYYWMIKAASLRQPHIWDYSRMNFVYTLLSKRKLLWFVEKGLVDGWDDPRFPTVRGIIRRGLSKEALKEYILLQGPSKNSLLLEWDKIWAINRKFLDPIAARHVALLKEGRMSMKLKGGSDINDLPKVVDVPLNKKTPSLGDKKTCYSDSIIVESCEGLEIGEQIALMDWGTAIISSLEPLEAKLDLSIPISKECKKLSWISEQYNGSTPLLLLDYDYLIRKKKLDDGDEFEDCVSEKTIFIEEAIGDHNLKNLKKGQVIQLEKRGLYICDEEYAAATGDNCDAKPCKLIYIPDGKLASVALKATSLDKK